MNEALVGVVIGGLLGALGPWLTLRYGERKWRLEAKLGHLKAERDQMEALFDKTLKLFAEAAVNNVYPAELTSNMTAFFPREITEIFLLHMGDKDKTPGSMKTAYFDLSDAMKRILVARDNEIRRLLGLRPVVLPHRRRADLGIVGRLWQAVAGSPP